MRITVCECVSGVMSRIFQIQLSSETNFKLSPSNSRVVHVSMVHLDTTVVSRKQFPWDYVLCMIVPHAVLLQVHQSIRHTCIHCYIILTLCLNLTVGISHLKIISLAICCQLSVANYSHLTLTEGRVTASLNHFNWPGASVKY